MKRARLILTFVLPVACFTAPDTRAQTGKPEVDSFVYEACMPVQVEEFKKMGHEKNAQTMAHLLCQMVAGDCQADLRGGPCKKSLREINDEMDKSGQSLAYNAAFAGRTDLIVTLIEVGVNVDKPVGGWTPLKMVAAWAWGWTGWTPPGVRWTPLMIAAAEGHAEVVSALIKAGANVNAENGLGRTALMFASNYGFTAIVKDLLAHGANPNIVPKDNTGLTALISAAKKGHVDVVRALLDHGADPGIKDKEGKNALAWADANGHAEVTRVLKDATAKKQ